MHCLRTNLYGNFFYIILSLFPIVVRITIARGNNSQANYGNDGRFPLVLNTWAFSEANKAAWKVLTESSSPSVGLDALVEGCSTCERLQCDGTVGFGGSPDENGETTLDAMIIDGATINVGAVGSLRKVKYASRVARLILEHTQHSLLVGSQASSFARMMGLPYESLNTLKSQQIWRNWHKNKCQPNYWNSVLPDAEKGCGPYRPEKDLKQEQHSKLTKTGTCNLDTESLIHNSKAEETCSDNNNKLLDKWHHDTIGMIVVDHNGNIFAGTSTNGATHKIPGRVGDSPIVGAGAYADNEVGAAVATGDGDILMRFLPSFLAVELMRNGKTPQEAGNESLHRIKRRYKFVKGALVVMDRWGNYSASCVGFVDGFPYMVSDLWGGSRIEKLQSCK